MRGGSVRAAALAAMATGLSGCFQGFGMLNALSTLNLLGVGNSNQASSSDGAAAAPSTTSSTTYDSNRAASVTYGYGSSAGYRASYGGGHAHRRRH